MNKLLFLSEKNRLKNSFISWIYSIATDEPDMQDTAGEAEMNS